MFTEACSLVAAELVRGASLTAEAETPASTGLLYTDDGEMLAGELGARFGATFALVWMATIDGWYVSGDCIFPRTPSWMPPCIPTCTPPCTPPCMALITGWKLLASCCKDDKGVAGEYHGEARERESEVVII